MRRASLVALAAAVMMAVAAPAGACTFVADPDGFDMDAAIAASDAAAIGVVTAIDAGGVDEDGEGEVVVTVAVTEIYKGDLPAMLDLERAAGVWGPTYEVGLALPVLSQAGEVIDGRWPTNCGEVVFTAADMRAAGGEPRLVATAPAARPAVETEGGSVGWAFALAIGGAVLLAAVGIGAAVRGRSEPS